MTLLVGTVLLETLLSFGDPLLLTSSHQRRGATLFMWQGNHIKVITVKPEYTIAKMFSIDSMLMAFKFSEL